MVFRAVTLFFIYHFMNTTICAIATGRGGAIGVIRVSGDKAIEITSKIFKSRGKTPLNEKDAYTLSYGTICDGEEIIDEVVVALYRAPHSYTGENSTEIMCHGSQYILENVLRLLIKNGCESAAPGEFTRRAFLNGKMDLSQAEAVADLIASTGRASHDIAMGQLRGSFSNSLARLREQLLKMTSLVELELDFSDQDVTFADREKLLNLANEISTRITSLANSFATGKAVKDGVPVAIIGKTNVGKSTLLNQLVHEDRAIVSDIHGTTRDVIEDTADINGVTFRFIDTAGIRNTDDTIEQLGIDRTYSMIEKATIVLWIMDAAPTEEELKDIESRTQGKHLIKVKNKIDVASSDFKADIEISAKLSENIDALESLIYKAADIPEIRENDVIVTNARHYDALLRASDSITRVIEGLQNNLPGDLLSEDLRDCIHILSEIVGGEISAPEVLNNIFSSFCIGK